MIMWRAIAVPVTMIVHFARNYVWPIKMLSNNLLPQLKNNAKEQLGYVPSRPHRSRNSSDECSRRKSSSLSRIEGMRYGLKIQKPSPRTLQYDSEYCTLVSSSLETIESLAEWVNWSTWLSVTIIVTYLLNW